MLFNDIIQNLYSGDKSSILEILNASIHIQELKIINDEPAIHTGYYCHVHTGSLFEFIYIISTKELCFQKSSHNNVYAPLGLPYICEYTPTPYSYKQFKFIHQKGIWYNSYNNITDTFSFIETNKTKEYEIQNKKVIKVNTKDDNIISQFKIKAKTFTISNNRRNLLIPENKEFNYKLNPLCFPKFYKSNKFHELKDNRTEESSFYDENYKRYEKYNGTYAQDIEGLDDDFIDDVLGGEPDAYRNID
ncbi:MAG TPA: hypothetical protein H9977_12315 [Candidatus Parabacteroides intestinipullorum]|uniref:Uncharacterized protein n=1 Tax=Candidatus Parabacteroides intestinipullorum TaxID=2838723 RepID=A0A9D1XA95_9BACT|nr:hypothetical protein [Candidatus Parabacteroides intestinipullorum]